MRPSIKLIHFTLTHLHTNKGVSLIIVIFAMMLLAVLGWSLAVLQSTDFESSLRQVESERALYLAESGAQWALRELRDDFSCANFNPDPNGCPPGGCLHNLNFGEYRVCCTCVSTGKGKEACNPPQCNNCPQLIIESGGYVPSEEDFRTQRQIRLVVDQGAFATAGSVRNLLDWSGMLGGSKIDGDLRAGHFNGDGDATYDEECEDYGVKGDCGEQLPPGDGERTQGNTTIPLIDMAHFKDEAENSRDYSATAEVSNGSSGEELKVVGSGIFDNSMDDEPEIVRIVGEDWSDGNWVVIKKYRTKSWVEVYLKDGMDMSDWIGKTVRVVKRFADKHNNEGLWYIEGSDILIDVRTKAQVSGDEENIKNIDKDAKFKKTSLVTEGDIIIKGSKKVEMDAYVEPSTLETFPNLATEGGRIYSKDYPKDGKKGRKFKGLIYSYKKENGTERGDIWFNCIDGKAIIGYNVTLEGQVKLKYDPKYVDEDGFLGAISTISWQEQ
mgnify:CR=1 FL=1